MSTPSPGGSRPRMSATRRIGAAPGRNTSTSPGVVTTASCTALTTAGSTRSLARRGRHSTSMGCWRPAAATIGAGVAGVPIRVGDPCGVDRGRHDEDPQVGADGVAGVERQRQTEIGLQVPLVELVEDDEAGAGEGRVRLHPPRQDALGDHLDAGRRTRCGARRGSARRRGRRPPSRTGRRCGGRPPGRRAGVARARRCARPRATARRGAATGRWSSSPHRARPSAPRPRGRAAPPSARRWRRRRGTGRARSPHRPARARPPDRLRGRSPRWTQGSRLPTCSQSTRLSRKASR